MGENLKLIDAQADFLNSLSSSINKLIDLSSRVNLISEEIKGHQFTVGRIESKLDTLMRKLLVEEKIK